MTNSLSLRARLTLVILLPLLVIAVLIGVWAYFDAERNAAERFDRSLLSTSLAISRDIAASGGDALSEVTRDLLRDTSGGAVFYHVYAPNGVFVTGYATPPVPPFPLTPDVVQTYYDAVYLGEPVRALRIAQNASVDGHSGLFTFTVWQDTEVRDGFVRTRTIPVFAIITSMIGALAVIVWFGVARGLAPLTNLEEAIARRSVDDLSPIKRSIPQEVTGIVGRFNALLSELTISINAKDAFISDAAHQLRNPIAGVMTLTDSVAKARDLRAVKTRVKDLQDAVEEVGHLTNSLLTFERIKAGSANVVAEPFEPCRILNSVVDKASGQAAAQGVALRSDIPRSVGELLGDPVMFEQAVYNVVNNALSHGGATLSEIQVAAVRQGDQFQIRITDDGKGISPKDFERALGRFSQVGPSEGSGLGLPIAAAVAESSGGAIELVRSEESFTVELTFPVMADA